MGYILVAILMIGILIALHEFGHFAAAKLCGVKVNEFSIGMGPLLFHRSGRETVYSLRALPIGGFCAMEGEEEGESLEPRAFPNRPWWQRLVILLAGVTMNFITGFLIVALLFSSNSVFYEPIVADFQENGLAPEQGLQIGDRIEKVDRHRIYLVDDIALFLQRRSSEKVDLEVRRGGERVVLNDFTLSKMIDGDGNGWIGLGITAAKVDNTPLKLMEYSWKQSVCFVRMVWMSIGDLVTGNVGLRDMSGIVGMVDMMGDIGEQGAQTAVENKQPAIVGAMLNILYFVAFISINLAVMNLLPIPVLDGGQVFLMAVNGVLLKVRGRKMDPKYRGWISAAGFACLLALMLAVTVSDVLKKFGI